MVLYAQTTVGREVLDFGEVMVSLVAALPPDILCVHSRFDVYCLHVVGPDPVAVVVAGITQLLLTDNPVDF